jgi:hypothetical protein
MRLLSSTFILFALINFSIDASISIVCKTTAQGYWYGRSYNARGSDNNEDLNIPFDISIEDCNDLYMRMSLTELLCFLSGILGESHPAMNKLIVWNYVKNNKLKIPPKDIASLRTDNVKLKIALKENENLLEKIKKFWGVDGNVHFYCFYSRADEKTHRFSGAWLANFVYGNDIYAMVLMCGPSLASGKMTLNEHISVLAHEFTHAMCDAAYGREKFEKVTSGFQSPNSVVAGWYLNEALAVVIGNGIFQEIVSQKKVDLSKEEYCAKGFAPALYELTKNYFNASKSIDKSFFKNAVKIFDKVHPNGYKDPNICLYKLYIICPNNIKQGDILLKLSKRTVISECYSTYFSDLKNEEIEKIKNANTSILVIFSDKKQLDQLRAILPRLEFASPVNMIHKNKRTYVFMHVDDKHSLQDCIDELFSMANN